MERRLQGVPAAPGLAGGFVQRLAPATGPARLPTLPALERRALHAAMAKAKAAFEALAARLPPAEAAILGFQIALLDDPELVHEAETAIAAGLPADRAWIDGMSNEIRRYEAAGDPHFSARASDLADLRDAVLEALQARHAAPVLLQPGHVLVAEDLTPSVFLRMDWTKGSGIVLGGGSAASHVAMLARGRGIPMVVGVGKVWADLSGPVLVDGEAGVVVLAPSREALARVPLAPASPSADANGPALTRDGRRIRVELNIATLSDLEGLAPDLCDGIGLVRTEFLVEQAITDEARQLEAYQTLIAWANGRPVTLRTLDAGGDKPVAGYSLEGGRNPFMGLRGIRLSLARPDLFRIQLRAILQAAASGPVRLLLPMVTQPDEVLQARALVMQVAGELAAEGRANAIPPIGMMLEVPVAAMAPDMFPVDFYSIGTNDLVQFACAAARDDRLVAPLAQPLHPGLLAMIRHAVSGAQASERPVSLCGDAAADPALLATFIGMGMTSFSVAPAHLAMVKREIARIDAGVAP